MDGPLARARFLAPGGLTMDREGSLIVADTDNHTIRKISPAGMVTTLAGLAGTCGSADGQGAEARFCYPRALTIDGGGNIYVADYGTIRKINPAGLVTTLAGTPGKWGRNDGTGAEARFLTPQGLATDDGGNVYVADSYAFTVRKITPAGVVTTIAGKAGEAGFVDGPGSVARFNQPAGLATDHLGNVYVTEQANRTIRKITPGGVVTTIAGNPQRNYRQDGPAAVAGFMYPGALTRDPAGNLYVIDFMLILKVTPDGTVTTLAGDDTWGFADGTGSAARFDSPEGVTIDSHGNLFVSEPRYVTIRKVTSAGVVTTFAGHVDQGSLDGPLKTARFGYPYGLVSDGDGTVYVADAEENTIRKITAAGVVSTLAGKPWAFGMTDGVGSSARFNGLSAIAIGPGGDLYVTDSYLIRKITRGGEVTTVPGPNERLSLGGIAVDSAGNIYVSDWVAGTIWRRTQYGWATLAGTAGHRGRLDGVGSAALFTHPLGLAVDKDANLYVADGLIRKVTPNGVVTTVAGSEPLLLKDGVGTAASFSYPHALAFDNAGDLYVADAGAVRRITPAGVVTTIAGMPGFIGNSEGTAAAARFKQLLGVTVDGGGNIYLTQQGSHAIHVGRTSLPESATIDTPSGATHDIRQLGTTSQDATSWQWIVIRRPAGSTAELSSTSVRNPTFTPDVADRYEFQLTASNGDKTSITTVSLNAVTVPKRRAARP
jgi:sugar lactone lactonase YvrE